MDTVTIEKDGWKVTGSTEEQLAIGIRAVQSALSGPVQRATQTPRVARTERKITASRESESSAASGERFVKNAKRAVRMLKALHSHGPTTETEPLMKSVAAESHKGFGGITAGINRAISACGFKIDDVYTSERLADGRRWHEQPKLVEAIASLEEAIQRSEG